MATLPREEAWPPQSARQALLCSPSGRKKYADIEAARLSPTKRLPGTPSLTDRMRLAKNSNEHESHNDEDEDEDEDEDDEETLQLKLAAIEAKLKLKKLQNKAKKEEEALSTRDTAVKVEVALSPIKRSNSVLAQRSPSRVLLGIDKGVRGADVSLRRARNIDGSPTKDRTRQGPNDTGRPISRTSKQTNRREKAAPAIVIKSFSERMADVRNNEREQEGKRNSSFQARARNFELDAAEMESFRAAAEQVKSQSRPRSPPEDTASRTNEAQHKESHGLRKVRTMPDLRGSADTAQGDASMYEGFSGLHLSSRILPHSFLKRTLPSDRFTIYKLPDLLKNITSPAYEIPDEVGDFVVFGVIASKTNPLDQKNRRDDHTKGNESEKKWDDGSQNRKKFMALTLTDLKWTVDMYLFDTALPRYHRLSPGTVIAVLNPSIMPPRKGREDTGAFSLALHDGDDTVLEIGASKDLGFCNSVKKDGKECGQWVNAAKSSICEWHLNAQIARTQSKRMGVNAGTNGFGGSGPKNRSNVFDPRLRGEGEGGNYGLLPAKQGRGFDRLTGSHYYISSSNPGAKGAPVYNPNVSTARMLDMEDGMFVAEGQFQRDKESMLQKRLANEEKERDIARKLANFGSGSSAGANYMRRRADKEASFKLGRDDVRKQRDQAAAFSSSPYPSTNGSHNLKMDIGKKRMAEDIRLSPVKKKTRFLTDKGIKEAGRESLGVDSRVSRSRHEVDEDDDDDDLDIV